MCSPESLDSPVIVGIEEIAAYLRRSTKIVHRMIRYGDLPVTWKHGAYMTSRQLLDEWLQKEAERNDPQIP